MFKGTTPLIIALVLAILAGATAFVALKKKEADIGSGWTPTPVLVATREIPEGTLITEELVTQKPVPEQFATRSVIRPEHLGDIMNQKVLVRLQPGDPILWSQFDIGRAERLSGKIQRKGRAVTIEANKAGSVGGWVRPKSDHVDVVGTFKDPQSNESVAVTLLQNVVVLATGKITGTTNIKVMSEGQREYANVTLLVIPEEAEMLVLAGEIGTLTLSLRNEDDTDMLEDRGRATIHTLLSGERTRQLTRMRQEAIRIIRGASSEGSSFTREGK